VLDLRTETELSSVQAPLAWEEFFTPLGVVILDGASIHILEHGAPPVRIDVPQWDQARESQGGIGGAAISGDGRLLVVERANLRRAEVFDVESRTTIASLRTPPGWPWISVSPDRKEIFLSSVGDSSRLTSYRLSNAFDAGEREGRIGGYDQVSPDGRFFVVFRNERGLPRVEVWERPDRLVRRFEDISGSPAISEDGRYLAEGPHDGVAANVWDVQTGSRVVTVPCSTCWYVRFAAGCLRLLTFGLEGTRLWSIPDGTLLCQPDKGSEGQLSDLGAAVSHDGTHIAWNRGTTIFVRDCASGSTTHFTATGPARALAFSATGDRLAIAENGHVELWDLPHLRTLWSLDSGLTGAAGLVWSTDQNSLLADMQGEGTVLLSARTGEILVDLRRGNAVNSPARDLVLPDLTSRFSLIGGRWRLLPFPPPETRSPTEALRHVLEVTGQVFRDGELEAAP